MPDLCRREFLKLFGIVGTGAVLSGCGEPATRYLIPFINPPEDVVPGKAVYYATTCRECPAGCGMLAKNREGRIVKVEGNPAHPIVAGFCNRVCRIAFHLHDPPFTILGQHTAAGRTLAAGRRVIHCLSGDDIFRRINERNQIPRSGSPQPLSTAPVPTIPKSLRNSLRHKSGICQSLAIQ